MGRLGRAALVQIGYSDVLRLLRFSGAPGLTCRILSSFIYKIYVTVSGSPLTLNPIHFMHFIVYVGVMLGVIPCQNQINVPHLY